MKVPLPKKWLAVIELTIIELNWLKRKSLDWPAMRLVGSICRPSMPSTPNIWANATGYMLHMVLRDSDQMSMAASLELRVPFLDHELVEFVLSLSARQKRNGKKRVKGLLVEACLDLLPSAVYDRPKMGFTLP